MTSWTSTEAAGPGRAGVSISPCLTRRGRALGVVLLVGACLQPGPTAPASLDGATGLWVLHVAGGRFDSHIQMWNVWEADDSAAPLRLGALATRWWDGTPDLQVDPRTSAGRLEGGEYRWTLDLGGGDSVWLRYAVVGDTARGTLLERASGTLVGPLPLTGVRIPPLIVVPTAPRTQLSQADSTPIVVLRMDDIPPTDRDFAQRLRARGLWAELAVPTRFVGGEGRLAWRDIRGLVDAGFSAAAHSRFHGSAPRSDADLMGEVLGSLIDLALENVPTAVFVQPGTWRDSLYFTTSGSLHTWRGSLFRTFTRDMEAYVYTLPRAMPLADSLRLGIGHNTISDGVSDAYILNVWRAALASRRFTVFMVHTWRLQSPGQLDWFLDSVAVAKQAGRIRLAHSTAEVFTP